VGPGKNRFETWQIFSAKIDGAKAPQKNTYSPRIHHQKSPIAHHFFAKNPEKQPPSPAHFFVSAGSASKSLRGTAR
jgi:hypothetical protein